ncbi:Reticulon-4-interacting protein 1 [Phytophthora cinnamomi]|uniref:Reticulon-4-interacting protein 1 n=1 Tax=Phytophthora cinnamomi TaxID=4785 RepID=UPI00355A165A|nr:Reticulon-4-interacting protein 1 [Phytophthora cinnamomi]
MQLVKTLAIVTVATMMCFAPTAAINSIDVKENTPEERKLYYVRTPITKSPYNRHFLKVYVLREFLELSSQTYQAYQYSRCLPRVWLNTLLVSMLLINCWSTLVVQHFLGKKPALERVVAILVDAAISIAMCAIVPCLLVAPYANAMDTANSSFKEPDQLYDPVFITRLVLEFQLTFALSLTLCGQSDPSSRSLHVDRSIGSLLTRSTQHAASVAKTIETPERFD